MVYPGATHTRLEHSIGCVHIATRLLELLLTRNAARGEVPLRTAFKLDEGAGSRAMKILRLAALLHDVGHPAFSHSGEELSPIDAATGKRTDHEQMTARIIRESEIREVIEQNYSSHGITVEEVIAVATKPSLARRTGSEGWISFLNGLLAGELGADRIDYLLRDAHHSGQPVGVFDHERLLPSIALVEAPEEAEPGFRLALDEGGWLVAEQMIVSRYLMYVSLYFHKTKRIYEIHLENFLRKWLDRELGTPALPWDLDEYLGISDSRIIAAIAMAARDSNHPAHLEARAFVDRSHLRLARELVLADNYQVISSQGLPDRKKPDPKRFDLLADYIRSMFGNARLAFDSKGHPATKQFEPRPDRVIVLLEGQPRYLPEVSEIMRGMPADIWRGRIYSDKDHREDVRSACADFLAANPITEAPR
ncbi:MAG: HD domain-containing protein [Phycisphaerales bacterium]